MSRFEKMDKGILTNIDMKQNKYKVMYIFMFLIMVIVCICNFIPILWMLMSGFKEAKEIYAIPPSFFPKEFRWSKIIEVWNKVQMQKTWIATLVLVSGSVISTLVVNGLAGYVLSRVKPKGSEFVSKLFFFMILLPSIGTTVPLYMLFTDLPIFHFSLKNTYIPMWMMSASNVFNIFLFKNFFDGISKSLIEAARIDGASDTEIFYKVILPLSLPIFITVGIFTFNASLGSFFWEMLLIDNKNMKVLGVLLYGLKSGPYTADEESMALFISIIPMIIVYLLGQKYIVGGINIGGVKG